jgi:hypothetical protein
MRNMHALLTLTLAAGLAPFTTQAPSERYRQKTWKPSQDDDQKLDAAQAKRDRKAAKALAGQAKAQQVLEDRRRCVAYQGV